MIGKDKLCAVVAAATAGSMWNQLRAALEETRTIELRLDWLADDAEIRRFLERLGSRPPRATLLATCRRKVAGGRYRGSIAKQLVHLAEAIKSGCAWYDLDVETASFCPPELVDVLLGSAKQLRSAHFFKAMPKDLRETVKQLEQDKPAGIKLAAYCASLGDCRRLAEFSRGKANRISIPMGDVAMAARILGLREPNGFAYAPVENITASGQTNLREMKSTYRADKIGPKTAAYGVIGDPIEHSLSPHLQNAGFAAAGVNAVYVPFLVHDLKDFIEAVRPLGVKGFSVTLPHKERILGYLDYCDPLAREIGAVNTVVVRKDGKLYGYNTDYVGVLRALERRFRLQRSRVLIVGAGGVARAVAFALKKAGASVFVCARRQKKAQAIARAMGGALTDWKRLRTESFDAIVNATPVGMYPLTDESPLEARELNCKLVFDTIYRPRVTKLMRIAEERGIETVSGVDMFIEQGIAQWELWMGKSAPVPAMRRAVLSALRREERDPKKR